MQGDQVTMQAMSPPAPSGTGLPGGGLVEAVVSWVWWLAMLAVLGSVVLAGGAYGFLYWSGRSGRAGFALRVLLASCAGGVVVGGAGVLANTLFGIGYRIS